MQARRVGDDAVQIEQHRVVLGACYDPLSAVLAHRSLSCGRRPRWPLWSPLHRPAAPTGSLARHWPEARRRECKAALHSGDPCVTQRPRCLDRSTAAGRFRGLGCWQRQADRRSVWRTASPGARREEAAVSRSAAQPEPRPAPPSSAAACSTPACSSAFSRRGRPPVPCPGRSSAAFQDDVRDRRVGLRGRALRQRDGKGGRRAEKRIADAAIKKGPLPRMIPPSSLFLAKGKRPGVT